MTRPAIPFIVGLLAAATLGACSDTRQPAGPIDASSVSAGLKASRCMPPTPDHLITLPIAPASERVDLATPAFTNPTLVINPLFPISNLSQVVLVGFVDGLPFRAETTLLPGTQPIDLGDRTVQVANGVQRGGGGRLDDRFGNRERDERSVDQLSDGHSPPPAQTADDWRAE